MRIRIVRPPRSAPAPVILVLLSACGGGGGDSGGGGPPPPPTNQSPGGIWTVEYAEASGPNTGDTIQARALVTETGDLFYAGINTTNGCATVGFGQVTVNGSTVAGSTNDAIVLFSQAAGVNTTCTYPDGSTSGTSTLSGTLAQRSSLGLTVTSTTSGGTALGSETHTWSYSSLYAETPSLATVAGNYADGSDTLTVSSDGTIFEQDPVSGCVVNGQASVVNPTYNGYNLTFTYSNCTGSAAVLNGITVTGLGYYDDSVSPNEIVVGLHATVNGHVIVVAGILPKM